MGGQAGERVGFEGEGPCQDERGVVLDAAELGVVGHDLAEADTGREGLELGEGEGFEGAEKAHARMNKGSSWMQSSSVWWGHNLAKADREGLEQQGCVPQTVTVQGFNQRTVQRCDSTAYTRCGGARGREDLRGCEGVTHEGAV